MLIGNSARKHRPDHPDAYPKVKPIMDGVFPGMVTERLCVHEVGIRSEPYRAWNDLAEHVTLRRAINATPAFLWRAAPSPGYKNAQRTMSAA